MFYQLGLQCGNAVGRATDMRFTGRGFESCVAELYYVVALGKLLIPVCLSQ